MEQTVNLLAGQVPSPHRVPYKGSFVFRYREQTIHQAIIQKLARLVSGLHVARMLMEAGFVQEQAVMQRVLDELAEDIAFLAFPTIFGQETSHHKVYLESFFQEEFDPQNGVTSSSKRRTVRREKIRAYIDKFVSGPKGSSKSLEASGTVHKVYSGYVHGASPQIMDMYGGSPPKFQMRGMRGTERQDEHRADLWNYFHRGIITFGFAAKAFGDGGLFDSIRRFSDNFLQATGDGYQSTEWK
jgi:hypothetical protein